jgi:hypothetical protein
MKRILFVTVMVVLFWAAGASAEQKAQGAEGGKAPAGGVAAGESKVKQAADDGKEVKPFVDRDGDGIRDGQEHRFRKRKHGRQDQEEEDETGTESGRRKRTRGQAGGGGQNRQGR